MGIKRRSMFNPKFKSSRPDRWELGQRIRDGGIPESLNTRMEEMDEIVDNTPTNEISDEKIEEMTRTVELMIEEVHAQQEPEEPVIEKPPMNYKKLKKSVLLNMAEQRGCDVTPKNTKAQIISALEKQSA